jgi:CheY-like chemotaxis protein
MGELYFAKTGTEALEVARLIVPDLILLDAHMPVLMDSTCAGHSKQRHLSAAFQSRS